MASRFDRQTILHGLGEQGQQTLRDAKVLVIGAGGLGCPVLTYLAAAGVGTIAVIDGDIVSITNLNRQVLYGLNDIGKPKAETAARVLLQRYDDVVIKPIKEFVNPLNVVDLIEQYDVVVDGTDNFNTRYLVNDACALLSKPLVFGAIYQSQGQVSVFNVADSNGIAINYRDLFPLPPSSMSIPNCAETGVLGVLPGMVGTMMATQTINVLTGYGRVLHSSVSVYNLVDHSFYEYTIVPNQRARSTMPASKEELAAYSEYACSIPLEYTWSEALRKCRDESARAVLVDIREPDELPKLETEECLCIPMSSLNDKISELERYSSVYLFCQHGARSSIAASTLQRHSSVLFYSIRGGISEYQAPFTVTDHEGING